MNEYQSLLQERAVDVSSLRDPGFREEVKAADVVLGWDVGQKREILLHGAEALEKARASDESSSLRVVVVAFDTRTCRVGLLYAAIEALKRRHVHKASGFPPQAPKIPSSWRIRAAMALVPSLTQLPAEGQTRGPRRRPSTCWLVWEPEA